MELGKIRHTARGEFFDAIHKDSMPLITPENIEGYRTGEIPVGKFNVTSVLNSESQEDCLTAQVMGITFQRATNQEDPLFCVHAAKKHEEYFRVLDSFNEPDMYANLYWQEYAHGRNGAHRGGDIPQLVVVGKTGEREIMIPGPIRNYLELRDFDAETIFEILHQRGSHPVANYLTAIYCSLPEQYFAPMGFADMRMYTRLKDTLVNPYFDKASHNIDSYRVAIKDLMQFGLLDKCEVAEVQELQMVQVKIPARPKVVFQPLPQTSYIRQSPTSISTAYFEYS